MVEFYEYIIFWGLACPKAKEYFSLRNLVSAINYLLSQFKWFAFTIVKLFQKFEVFWKLFDVFFLINIKNEPVFVLFQIPKVLKIILQLLKNFRRRCNCIFGFLHLEPDFEKLKSIFKLDRNRADVIITEYFPEISLDLIKKSMHKSGWVGILDFV